MSLIPNAILGPALQKGPRGQAAVLIAGALKVLRDAVDARAGSVTGDRRKP